jgi:hypothetical protein
MPETLDDSKDRALSRVTFTPLERPVLEIVYGGPLPKGVFEYAYASTGKGALKAYGLEEAGVHVVAVRTPEGPEIVRVVDDFWTPDFSYQMEKSLSDLRRCLSRPAPATPAHEAAFQARPFHFLMGALALEIAGVVSPLLSREGVIQSVELTVRTSSVDTWPELPRERFVSLLGREADDLPKRVCYLRVDQAHLPAIHPEDWLPTLVAMRHEDVKFLGFITPISKVYQARTLNQLRLELGVLKPPTPEEDALFQAHRDEFYLAAEVFRKQGMPALRLPVEKDGAVSFTLARMSRDEIPGKDMEAKLGQLCLHELSAGEYGFKMSDRLIPTLREQLALLQGTTISQIEVAEDSILPHFEPNHPAPRAFGRVQDVDLVLDDMTIILIGVPSEEVEALQSAEDIHFAGVIEEDGRLKVQIESLIKHVTLTAYYCGIGVK